MGGHEDSNRLFRRYGVDMKGLVKRLEVGSFKVTYPPKSKIMTVILPWVLETKRGTGGSKNNCTVHSSSVDGKVTSEEIYVFSSITPEKPLETCVMTSGLC